MEAGKLIVLIVLFLAVVGLFVVSSDSFDEDLVGQAGKRMEKKTERGVSKELPRLVATSSKQKRQKGVEPRETGCYLEFATKGAGGGIIGGTNVWISDSYEDCQSYALAFQFGVPEDALRLIITTPPPMRSSEIAILQNEVNILPGERVYIVKWNDYSQISSKGGPVTTIFQQNLDDEQCTTVNFFGAPLYCFNGVVVPSVGRLKDNNYDVIIQPLTFLKLSGLNGMWNPFAEESGHPFEFIVKEEVEFIDGTMVMALNAHLYSSQEINDLLAIEGNIDYLEIKDVNCLEEGSDVAARFQYRSQDLTIKYPQQDGLSVNSDIRYVSFFCRTDTGFDRRMSYAGILFHEANHKFKGHESAVCSSTVDEPDGFDDDWDSVYGAHSYYLFEASENEMLTCQERTYLYDTGTSEFDMKLCLESHSFNPPDCMIAGTNKMKVVSKEKSNTIVKKRLQPVLVPYY